MRNFPITDQNSGKEYWISRSMAVCAILVVYDNLSNEYYLLANKRGAGTPDFQHCWNIPCGYLDWDETTKDAAIREVYEETGVKLETATFWGINDQPTENHQNVTFRYYSILGNSQIKNLNIDSNSRGGEEQEVDAVKWIPISEINNYDWAFDHDIIIKDFIETFNLK